MKFPLKQITDCKWPLTSMFTTRFFFGWLKMLLKMKVLYCPKLPQHPKFPHLTVAEGSYGFYLLVHALIPNITWRCRFWREMTSIFPWQWALLGCICLASSKLVCNEGQRMSPYSPRQSLALFMEDSTNYCCQKQHHNFHSCSQIRCK